MKKSNDKENRTWTMTLPTLPTYIPIKDAAKRYGYDLDELKSLAQSGKIKAVQLPDGDMVVSKNELEFPEINSKEELEAYRNEFDNRI